MNTLPSSSRRQKLGRFLHRALLFDSISFYFIMFRQNIQEKFGNSSIFLQKHGQPSFNAAKSSSVTSIWELLLFAVGQNPTGIFPMHMDVSIVIPPLHGLFCYQDILRLATSS
jgi:hypothetical protein